MPETFLILLAAGVMVASAIPRPRDVTLQWLRLAGIIAAAMLGLSAFFFSRRDGTVGRSELLAYVLIGGLIAAQLALVQINQPGIARFAAIAAFVVTIPFAVQLLRIGSDEDSERNRKYAGDPIKTPDPFFANDPFFAKHRQVPVGAALVGCAGVAVLSGIALMEMLLGHAYLTAAQMTMAPFRRMNLVFTGALALRMFFALVAILMQQRWPSELFWTRSGFMVAVRWLVGLLVPCIFVYMTHDCIKRRSTQSATGILYVAGVLIFIGEMIALYLTRETGLPF